MADRSIEGNLSQSSIGACGSWSSTTCPLGLGDSALTPDRARTTRPRTTPLLECLVRGWARPTGAPIPLPSVHPYALTCGVRVLTVFPSPPLNSRGWSGQLLGRRYRRTASGANTAMIAADQARAQHLAGDGPPGRQGALAEDQPAQRVGGHGDRLVGGERLQPAGHGLD